MRIWRVGLGWYAAALVLFPVLILVVLGALSLISQEFAPNFAVMGVAVGLLAGFFEEIGWMGYAFPKMARAYGVLAAAVFLGLLHSTWHVVADYLGASAALGAYWLPHFFFFMTVSMTATRVLIVWVYQNTGSVLVAQAAHASSTGFLFALAPIGLTPGYDTLWYAVYGAVLWIVVAIVVAVNRRRWRGID
jgi:membrane protease YdiL (CAAX protease family)